MHRPTPPSIPGHLDEAELCAWLGEALPGDRLIYHRGCLAMDCSPATSRMTRPDRTRLDQIARRARTAQELGLARLVQRRHAEGNYSYIIVACSRRIPSPKPEGTQSRPRSASMLSATAQ